MNRKDLENYRLTDKWTKARISFLEEQIKNVSRINSVISDMPKGSKKVYDSEAENLVLLIDQIEILKNQIKKENLELENRIVNELNKLKPKQALILYHYFILGNSMKYIAKEILHYEEKYTYTLKEEALKEFDKLN